MYVTSKNSKRPLFYCFLFNKFKFVVKICKKPRYDLIYAAK